MREQRKDDGKAEYYNGLREEDEKQDRENRESFSKQLAVDFTVTVSEGRAGAWLSFPDEFPTLPGREVWAQGITGISVAETGGERERGQYQWGTYFMPALIEMNMTSGRYFYLKVHPDIQEVVLAELIRVWKEWR